MCKVPHAASQRFKFLCGKGRKAKQEKAKKQKEKGDDKEEVESNRYTEEDSLLLPLFPHFDLDFSWAQPSKSYLKEMMPILVIYVLSQKNLPCDKIALAG